MAEIKNDLKLIRTIFALHEVTGNLTSKAAYAVNKMRQILKAGNGFMREWWGYIKTAWKENKNMSIRGLKNV